MKQTVFHIGPHKTGSTYIQRMMLVNRARFPASHAPVAKTELLFQAFHHASLQLSLPDELPERLQLVHGLGTQIARSLSAQN